VPVGEVGGLDAHALQPWPSDVTRPNMHQAAGCGTTGDGRWPPPSRPIWIAAFRAMAEMTAGWVAPAPGLASPRP
jgi:hypothetical protein